MIFSKDESTDVGFVLTAIEAFIFSIKKDNDHLIEKIDIDKYEVESLIRNMRNNFPYYDGVWEKASAFKKIAVFMSFFMNSSPLKGIRFEDSHYLHDDYKNHLSRYLNAEFIVRFMVILLIDFTIHRSDCEQKVEIPIAITKHSYIDLVETLGTETSDICHQRISLLALFIEQLVYKTNPECQYPDFMCGGEEYIKSVIASQPQFDRESAYPEE